MKAICVFRLVLVMCVPLAATASQPASQAERPTSRAAQTNSRAVQPAPQISSRAAQTNSRAVQPAPQISSRAAQANSRAVEPSLQPTPQANRNGTADSERAEAQRLRRNPVLTSASTIAKRAAPSDCEPCGAVPVARTSTRAGRRIVRVAAAPCHQRDYVDPRVRGDLNAALRELKRAGVTPRITSAWRSSVDQGRMYRCSSSRRCRLRHPGLFRAMPPGQSAHEAGLAVDISGIAAGRRGSNHLTAQGRRIVQVMEKHGFNWKYGLADPVHFEGDPRDYGYRNLSQAIHVTQTRCQASVLARTAGRTRGLERRPSLVRTEARTSRVSLRRKA